MLFRSDPALGTLIHRAAREREGSFVPGELLLVIGDRDRDHGTQAHGREEFLAAGSAERARAPATPHAL